MAEQIYAIPRNELLTAVGGNLRICNTLERIIAFGSESEVFSGDYVTKLSGIAEGATVGADWATNLLNIPSVILSTTASYTLTDAAKLSGIEAGAEVNVQSDWNATSGDAFILNKPTIPAAQVNSDWSSTSGVSQILNKPTIPAAQVNSDWSSTSGVSQILNKPTIPAAQVNSDWNSVSGVSQILNKPDVSLYQNQTLSREIGLQFDSTKYFLVATLTVTGAAYTGAFLRLEILGQGRTLYQILVNAYVNGSATAFDSSVCSCDVLGRLGIVDGDSFTLVVNYSTRTAKLYYRHPSNAWNTKWIAQADSKGNACTIDITRDATGVSTLPTSDFSITTLQTV